MSKKLYIGNIELATAADLQAVEARVLKLLPEVTSESENQLVVTSVSGLKAVDPVEFLSKSFNPEQFETKNGVLTLKSVDAQVIKVAGTSLETTLSQFATKEELTQFATKEELKEELTLALSWGNLDVQ